MGNPTHRHRSAACAALLLCLACSCRLGTTIDRQDLVERNSPRVNSIDKMLSLSVGNGRFAFTVDGTGLQTFAAEYASGVPLGTQSDWGWHRFENVEHYRIEDTYRAFDLGHRNSCELYCTEPDDDERAAATARWFRSNPHRISLGTLGFELTTPDGRPVGVQDIAGVDQRLDMWNGCISSRFVYAGTQADVRTACHPDRDLVAVDIRSRGLEDRTMAVGLTFDYPTGRHTDSEPAPSRPDLHVTRIVGRSATGVTVERRIDDTFYRVRLTWQGKASATQVGPHHIRIEADASRLQLMCEFVGEQQPDPADITFDQALTDAGNHWHHFWHSSAAVDFSACTDPRARELERRVVLSQYLTAIQCAGSTPPQETGLTYNSWYGKFHLEMYWWHAAHFALWNHPEVLERGLDWFVSQKPKARVLAHRQGYKGVRWTKMTSPAGAESPSYTGSFLIWQQPHCIYLAELLYRCYPTNKTLGKYKDIVLGSADFMADFAMPDSGRYVLRGYIPAQETLRAAETVNSPFELAYWHFGLTLAERWAERVGIDSRRTYVNVADSLARPAMADGLYLAAESAPDTYADRRFTSDHPAVLGACGVVPPMPGTDSTAMRATLEWVLDKWNWDKSWGWDYPMAAMCATRLGQPRLALDALLMPSRTNTYLPNGHNYQDQRLRIYLPGNGALLTAVAMMCAGWDGCTRRNPGFPDDGTWNVRWEGLKPLP